MAYATSKREIPGALVWFPQRVDGEVSARAARAREDRVRQVPRRHDPKPPRRNGLNHTMGTSLSCRRPYKASEDCAACHY